MRQGFPKDGEIPAIFRIKITIEQKPNYLISFLEMTTPPCLRLLAASLCNCQRQLIYVPRPRARTTSAFAPQLGVAWRNIPRKAQTFLWWVESERRPDALSNNSITNLIWNRTLGFKFAREVGKGSYFIHEVVFKSEMIQLTKHSELKRKHSPWRNGSEESQLADVGPSEPYKLSATTMGLAGSTTDQTLTQQLL